MRNLRYIFVVQSQVEDIVLWQLLPFSFNLNFYFIVWFAPQVDKYFNGTIASYCTQHTPIYSVAERIWHIATLLIFFAAISCLSSMFKHMRLSPRRHLAKDQDESMPVEGEEPPRSLLLRAGSLRIRWFWLTLHQAVPVHRWAGQSVSPRPDYLGGYQMQQ